MTRIVHLKTNLSKPVKRGEKPKKYINKISDKQRKHLKWIEQVARPYLIKRDGDLCQCCKRVHYPHDVDHILGKGSHVELKENLDNLQLLGRFPCHHLKTIGEPCEH